jgi:ABC-type transport system involved in multi-copper enzyme maturation permease subunit
MSSLLVALRAEAFLVVRGFGGKLVVLAPAGVALLQFLFTQLTTSGQAARQSLLGNNDFDAVAATNAYGYFVDGIKTGLTILTLLLVAQAAYSFSSERDLGTLRHLLIRRASRSNVVLAKLLLLHLQAVIAVLLLLLAAGWLAGVFWEYGAVVEDGYELISVPEIHAEIRSGILLALLPMPAAIAFGVLVSVSAQSVTQAVTTALGITLALDIFKSMLGDWGHYLYASFQPSLLDQSYLQDVSRLVRGYSDVLIDERFYQLNLWVPLPTLLLFVVASLIIVRLRQV